LFGGGHLIPLVPAEAGIQRLDSRFRGNERNVMQP
jgi:hypothetical protein